MDNPTGGQVGLVEIAASARSMANWRPASVTLPGPFRRTALTWRPRHADGFAVRLRLLNLQHQLSRTGAELLFEVFSQRYERGSILVTTNLPFDEWTEVFGSERLTGALLDRLTHHVHILEMNGESYRLKRSRETTTAQAPDDMDDG